MKLKMLFGVEFEDGKGVNTSDSDNRVSAMVSIKHEKDSVAVA